MKDLNNIEIEEVEVPYEELLPIVEACEKEINDVLDKYNKIIGISKHNKHNILPNAFLRLYLRTSPGVYASGPYKVTVGFIQGIVKLVGKGSEIYQEVDP